MSEGVQTGLVGFFDILGYKNLLERNEPEIIAKEVIPIINGIRNNVLDQLQMGFTKIMDDDKKTPEAHKAGAKDFHESIIKDMNWLVFSDTVLVTLPIPEAEAETLAGANCWLVFYRACRTLQKEFFKSRLPLRGAIDYGKFYIEDYCFAGRTIVNSYELCNRLNLAACVLTDSAEEQFIKIEKVSQQQEPHIPFVVKYLVPLKEGAKNMHCVLSSTWDPKGLDIRNQVIRSFSGYSKDISSDVQPKIDNTERWLRFLHNYLSETLTKLKTTPPAPPR